MITPGERRVSRRIARLKFESLEQLWYCDIGVLRPVTIRVGQSAQNQVIGAEIFRAFSFDPLDFELAQVGLDRADHAHCDFVLQLEDVAVGSVITISPQMAAGLRLDEL